MRDRQTIMVQGAAQGLGSRPDVYGLASRLALDVTLRNDTVGPMTAVKAAPTCPEHAPQAWLANTTLLACIQGVSAEKQPIHHDATFAIQPSGARDAFINPDLATCPRCRRQFKGAHDRRWDPILNTADCKVIEMFGSLRTSMLRL